MEDEKYIVYVKIDEQDRIYSVNSSAFIDQFDGWIPIDSGYGTKYHHAQGHYFDSIFDENGAYMYKLVDMRPVIRSEAERMSDIFAAEQPSQLDQIEAQVMYTALMTDTLLEMED